MEGSRVWPPPSRLKEPPPPPMSAAAAAVEELSVRRRLPGWSVVRRRRVSSTAAVGDADGSYRCDMVRGSRSGGRQSSGRGSTGRPPAQLGASSSAGRGSSIPTAGRGSSIPTAGRPFRAPLPHDMIQSVLPPPGPHAPTPRAPPPPPVSAPLPPPPVSAPLPPPPDLAAVGQTAYTPSPPLSAGGLDDQASQHEGEGSTDVHTGRTVWINAGGKIEPSTASNYITRMIKTHFPGPVHQFSNFPLGAQDLLFEDFMRQFTFIHPSQQAKAKEAWRTTAAANFKQLLYKMRKKAEEASRGMDMAQWKAHGPDWMQQVHWDGLCDIWADERWTEKSAKMKANRAAQPEKNLHTGGSVSFATHKTRLETQLKRPAHFQEVFDVTHKKKGTDDYISARARETVESYGTRMEEKYGDKDQQPELDPEIWVEASGAPKKGHVYGFGHSLGSSRVLSSCASAASHATSPFATPAAAGAGSSPAPSMSEEQIMSAVHRAVAEAMSQGFSQMMSQGFSPRRAETPRHPHGAAPSQQHQDGPSAAGADDQDDDAA